MSKIETIMADGNSGIVGVGEAVAFGEGLDVEARVGDGVEVGADVGFEAEVVGAAVGAVVGAGVGVGVGLGAKVAEMVVAPSMFWTV